jgi:hypothetical protein
MNQIDLASLMSYTINAALPHYQKRIYFRTPLPTDTKIANVQDIYQHLFVYTYAHLFCTF